MYRFNSKNDPNEDITIGFNHKMYSRKETGLYIGAGNSSDAIFMSLDVEDIPKMIRSLQEVYDAFEEMKPTVYTADVLEALTDGSVVSFNNEHTQWVKVSGAWVAVDYTDLPLAPYWHDRDRAATDTVVVRYDAGSDAIND